MDNLAKVTPTGTELLNGRGHQKKIITPAHEPLANEIPPGLTEISMKPSVMPPAPPVMPDPAKPLKIAMIGTAPSSRSLAPFNDPEWTIWGSSPGNMNQLPRVDAWFEIHSNLLFPECVAYGQPYIDWLKKQKFPIYMQDQRYVPNAISLPIQELVTEFGKYFFTSTFAYMIAMGIRMGATEIALFGIDMASKDEYILQRPGGHFFMQKAAERGIKVSIPFESDLAQPPELYGYGSSTPFGRKIQIRKKEIEDRIAAMKGERDKLHHAIAHLEGALEDVDYIKSIWGGLQT